MSNKSESKNLIFSILQENSTPNNTPLRVAKKPIEKPTKKNILAMDFLLTPRLLKMAISLVLLFTKIVNPYIILNAATTIISDNIINITFLSTFKAPKKDLFKSAHE